MHGAAVTASVVAASQALFGRGDLDVLDERTLADATAEPAECPRGGGDARGAGAGRHRPGRRPRCRPPHDRGGRGVGEQRAGERRRRCPDAGAGSCTGGSCCCAAVGARSPQGWRRVLPSTRTTRPGERTALPRGRFDVSQNAPVMFSTSARQGGTDTERWPVSREDPSQRRVRPGG
nr:hypothetical protein [Angustibacter aerolatus]